MQALLVRANGALERGRGPEAVQALSPLLRSAVLSRDEEFSVRGALADAWLLQDDVEQAASVLGRTPDTFREVVAPSQLSTLWCMHGRIAALQQQLDELDPQQRGWVDRLAERFNS